MPNLLWQDLSVMLSPHQKTEAKKKNTALIMTFSQETHKKQKKQSLNGTDEHGNLWTLHEGTAVEWTCGQVGVHGLWKHVFAIR